MVHGSWLREFRFYEPIGTFQRTSLLNIHVDIGSKKMSKDVKTHPFPTGRALSHFGLGPYSQDKE